MYLLLCQDNNIIIIQSYKMHDILQQDLISPLQGLQLIFTGISHYIPFLNLAKMGTSVDELRCFDEDIRIMGYKTKQQAMAMFKVNKNMYQVLTNIFTQSEKMYKQYAKTNVMPKNIYAERKRKVRISQLIKFNINSLNSNNIDYIVSNLYPIITKDMKHCQLLVNLILKNMTRDRKQINLYAKLVKNCSQISGDQFMFVQQSTANNPLIDYLTGTIAQKSARLNNLLEDEQKLGQKSGLRAYLIAQAKLVAELRKQGVLTNQQTKLYIGKLMKQFVNCYDRNVDKRIKKITFSYYIEAVIQMIDQLGTTFEQLDDTQQIVQNTKKPISRSPFYMWVQSKLLKISARQYNVNIQSFKQNYQHLTSEQIMKSLTTVQKHLLNKVQNIEAIKEKLQKLIDRRKNKWHDVKVSTEEKMDASIVIDIRMSEFLNQIARIQSYYLQYAEQGLQRILFDQFDDTQMQEKNECISKRSKSLRNSMSPKLKSKLQYITKNYDENLWMTSYLKLVADDKKSKIQARISFFHFLLQCFESSCEQTFPVFWHRYLDQICKLAEQLPYFTSALAFILSIFISSKPTSKPNYKIFYKQNNPIITQIFQKIFHYSEDEEILKQMPQFHLDCRIKNLL